MLLFVLLVSWFMEEISDCMRLALNGNIEFLCMVQCKLTLET